LLFAHDQLRGVVVWELSLGLFLVDFPKRAVLMLMAVRNIYFFPCEKLDLSISAKGDAEGNLGLVSEEEGRGIAILETF
jgi:hypothetical protein